MIGLNGLGWSMRTSELALIDDRCIAAAVEEE
jgi:hypothetical protein